MLRGDSAMLAGVGRLLVAVGEGLADVSGQLSRILWTLPLHHHLLFYLLLVLLLAWRQVEVIDYIRDVGYAIGVVGILSSLIRIRISLTVPLESILHHYPIATLTLKSFVAIPRTLLLIS